MKSGVGARHTLRKFPLRTGRAIPLSILIAALVLFSSRDYTAGQPVAGFRQSPHSQDAGKQNLANVDFVHEVAPILKSRCAKCHMNGKHEANLSLDTRQGLLKAKAAVPGKADESELYLRIVSSDPEERMPSKGPALSAKEVATIKNWINQGLAWDANFTFAFNTYQPSLKPRRHKIPPSLAGTEHPIDRILAAYFTSHQIKTVRLDDTAFIRRISLDLVGLLPARSEVEAFLQDDRSDKRTRVIQRLLQEQRPYAEHWLSFWNDMLRNDYQGTGYIDGGRKQITAWLYQSLLENKPYNQFVRELVAPSADSAGFIEGIKWRGRVNASQVREIQFSQNVSQVFFGINMKCASCHDSFIDTWKLADAYGLAAVIADAPLEIHRCDKATGAIAEPRFVFPELGSIDASLAKPERLNQLAGLVTHPDNGRFARTIVNRLWHRLMGRGIVHPVDIMANRPWNEDLLDYLAVYLVDQGYDLKAVLEHIVTSNAYQSACSPREQALVAEEYRFLGPEVKRMTAEQFLDAVWMITRAGPAAADAKVPLTDFSSTTTPERRFIRASLVNADALQRSLGRPNREQVVTTRSDDLTTLQALDLSNGETLYDTLAKGAISLVNDDPNASPERLIDTIYLQALCRRPSADESVAAQAIVGAEPTPESVADLLWVVCMLPEFQLIR